MNYYYYNEDNGYLSSIKTFSNNILTSLSDQSIRNKFDRLTRAASFNEIWVNIVGILAFVSFIFFALRLLRSVVKYCLFIPMDGVRSSLATMGTAKMISLSVAIGTVAFWTSTVQYGARTFLSSTGRSFQYSPLGKALDHLQQGYNELVASAIYYISGMSLPGTLSTNEQSFAVTIFAIFILYTLSRYLLHLWRNDRIFTIFLALLAVYLHVHRFQITPNTSMVYSGPMFQVDPSTNSAYFAPIAIPRILFVLLVAYQIVMKMFAWAFFMSKLVAKVMFFIVIALLVTHAMSTLMDPTNVPYLSGFVGKDSVAAPVKPGV